MAANDVNRPIGHQVSVQLGLLLIGSMLSKIFESSTNNFPVEASAITTVRGVYNTTGVTEHMIERLPILSIDENGNIGYVISTRLDLDFYLCDLASQSNIDMSEIFKDRYAIFIFRGFYTFMRHYNDAKKAMAHTNEPSNEFPAVNIVWSATITNKDDVINFRRLEATAKYLREHQSDGFPKMPDDWMNGVLNPMFKHVEEKVGSDINRGNQSFS